MQLYALCGIYLVQKVATRLLHNSKLCELNQKVHKDFEKICFRKFFEEKLSGPSHTDPYRDALFALRGEISGFFALDPH